MNSLANGIVSHGCDVLQSEGIEITQEQAKLFEKIHYEKINMSDEIFVIDVNGYIGNSTRKEIDYAKQHGKSIHYYSQSDIK